jgi:hypothetical protein
MTLAPPCGVIRPGISRIGSGDCARGFVTVRVAIPSRGWGCLGERHQKARACLWRSSRWLTVVPARWLLGVGIVAMVLENISELQGDVTHLLDARFTLTN